MRLLWLMFFACGIAAAQIDPEAARLFHAATQSQQGLPTFDLELDRALSMPTARGVPVVIPKHISISVRQPGKEKFIAIDRSKTDTLIVSDNSAWYSSEGLLKYGTRPGILRRNQVLLPQEALGVFPVEHDFTSAQLAGNENLLVGGKSYPCTVIRIIVTRPLPEGGTFDSIETMWVEKETDVALKREQTSTFPRAGSSTTVATRFLAGPDVLPLNLDRIPPKGSVEDEIIFEEAMLALPVHGRILRSFVPMELLSRRRVSPASRQFSASPRPTVYPAAQTLRHSIALPKS